MSALLQKGSPYSRIYSSTDWPTLTSDWSATTSLYTAYPGTAVAAFNLVRVSNTLVLTISAGDILNLSTGTYYMVTHFSNPVLSVSLDMIEYATVSDIVSYSVPMCRLFMHMTKPDGVSAGKEIRTMSNTSTGTAIVLGWQGIPVTATNVVVTSGVPKVVAVDSSGVVVDTEQVTATTDRNGFVELYVIRGLTVLVTCPTFGKSLTIDTTGLTEVDLSTLI